MKNYKRFSICIPLVWAGCTVFCSEDLKVEDVSIKQPVDLSLEFLDFAGRISSAF